MLSLDKKRVLLLFYYSMRSRRIYYFEPEKQYNHEICKPGDGSRIT